MTDKSCELRVAGCELGQLRRNRYAPFVSRLACEASGASQARRLKKTRVQFATRNSQLATAFTLTELLIVIGLIVLILVLAVPALDFITGSNSTDAAQNQISAMLGRARAEAIGLQEPVGVAFFRDPANDRLTMAMVQFTPSSLDVASAIDFIADRDQQLLPPGIGMHLIWDSGDPADPYIEHGAVFFDGFGKVIHQDIEVLNGSAFATQYNVVPNIPVMGSQFGFVLYNREAYDNKPTAADKLDYLDNESLPLLVNRYNGTLVKGE